MTVSTGEIRKLPARGDAKALAFADLSDELAVVTSFNGGTIQRFDVATNCMELCSISCAHATCVAYQPTLHKLFVGNADGACFEYDISPESLPEKRTETKVSRGTISHVSVNDGRIYLSTESGFVYTSRLGELAVPGALECILKGCDWDIYALACHSVAAMGVAAGFGGYVRFFRMHNPKMQLLPTMFRYITLLQHLPHSGLLAIAGKTGIELWNIEYAVPFLVQSYDKTDVKTVREVGRDLFVVSNDPLDYRQDAIVPVKGTASSIECKLRESHGS
jgi:hypothetical protein